MNNILEIVSKDTCLGCSVCIASCPIDIIHKEHKDGFLRPILNDDECLSKCTICMDICPSVPKTETIAKKNNSDYFISYSKNKNIRQNGQSGGFITQYLIELFENNIIDCAVVAYLDINTIHNKNMIIDKTMDYKDLLMKASGSKYTSSVMEEGLVKKLKRYHSIAFVGLPCQLNAISQIGLLNKKIYCKIGLVCDRVMSENFSKLFIDKNTIDFKYRSKEKNGYPGDLKIVSIDKEIFIDKQVRHRLKFLYTQPQCLECNDKNAKYADIVVGDNYIAKFKNDKLGTSIIEDRKKLLNKLDFKSISLDEIEEAEYNNSVRVEQKEKLVLKFKSSIFFKFIVYKILPLFHSKLIPLKIKIIVSASLKKTIQKIYKVKL
jgi:coenzyme F420-reducing hydrogenase beta subunit